MKQLKQLSFTTHLVINITIRLCLIAYGEFQDSLSEVQYTDVDYRVVTDGSRHLLANESPYARHTYRYSPILAYMLIPNVMWHKCIGKIIFALFDLLVGILIRKILCDEFSETFRLNSAAVQDRLLNTLRQRKQLCTNIQEFRLPEKYKQKAMYSSLVWLYNPLTMVIATRGNGDSITSFLVLGTMYFLLKPSESFTNCFIAGIIHGLAIHMRLYPLLFSLAYYLYTANVTEMNILKLIFLPNKKQIGLVFGTAVSLATLTILFFNNYGYEFLYETYLYHLVRKDTRHNFSLYFYMQYLNAGYAIPLLQKVAKMLPQLIILIVTSFQFSRNRKTLPFAIFILTFTMVAFNTVVTSQYFVWYLSVFPLCLKNWSRIKTKTAFTYGLLWFLTQCAWLLTAYFLEFKGWNTFQIIWMHGCMFFCANIFILQRLIINFNVIADFKLK